MATKVFMEALSPTMEEGRLVKWLRNEGDAVTSGETIAEVETDKAIMELVARADGVLRRRLIAEGATAPVGTVIGVIATVNENIDAFVGRVGEPPSAASPPVSTPAATAAPPAQTVAAPLAPPATAPPATAPPAPLAALAPVALSIPDSTSSDTRPRSSPLARRIAAERGLALGAIEGSGPGGRIIKRDVESAVAAPAATLVTRPPSAVSSISDYADIPLTQLRKTM